MERDTLIIKNGYSAFINNRCSLKKQNNRFTVQAENLLKGEEVECVSLHPYSFNVSDRNPQDGRIQFLNGRMVNIEFSNGKKIVFTTSIDTNNDTVFLQV